MVPHRRLLGQRLLALFALGWLLFNYPLLTLFDQGGALFGVPVLYAYLFSAWLLLVLLVAWVAGLEDPTLHEQGD